MSIDRVLALAAGQPWALQPEKVAEIQALLELRAAGVRSTPAEIEARVGPGRTGQSAQAPAGVAVIPVIGVLSQRANLMNDISAGGGTSTMMVGAAFRRALADPDISTILLEFDSPGGGTEGTGELADEIYRARGRKPIVAQVNSLAASAAYWIAVSADELVMTPGGFVGSIGVYAAHSDMSGAMEKAGIRKTFIQAGEYKTEGHPYAPLSDEARDYEQKIVNEVYGTFVNAVARGRKTTAARVRAEFGKGRTVGAREALRLGMVDRVATMEDTIRRLLAKPPSASRGRSLASLSADDAELHALRQRRHAFRMRTGGFVAGGSTPRGLSAEEAAQHEHRRRLHEHRKRTGA